MVRTKKQVIDHLAARNRSPQALTFDSQTSTSAPANTESAVILLSNPSELRNVPTTTEEPFNALTQPRSPVPTFVNSAIGFNHQHLHSTDQHNVSTALNPAAIIDSSFNLTFNQNNFWPTHQSYRAYREYNNGDIKNEDGEEHLRYHHRLYLKGNKIKEIFTNLSDDEIAEMLVDCNFHESMVLWKLANASGYVDSIRQRIIHQEEQKRNHVVSNATDTKSTNSSSNFTLQTTIPSNGSPANRLSDEPTSLPSPKSPSPIELISGRYSNTENDSSDMFTNQDTKLTKTLAATKGKQKDDTKINLDEKRETYALQEFDEILKDRNAPTHIVAKASSQHNAVCRTHKKHGRRPDAYQVGRLALDDALQQIQDSNADETEKYKGWSDARVRAHDQIHKNPNSYYYRFNAPGEQQSKGKWTDEENRLFFERLEEMGANAQWGIFSMTIPGRVGYQCSNYYRQLIESGQMTDPNYIIDEKGKARYLYEKKNENGETEKIIRKHSKHGSVKLAELSKLADKSSEDKSTSGQRKAIRRRYSENDGDDKKSDPTFSINNPSSIIARNKKKTRNNNNTSALAASASNNTESYRMTRQRLQYNLKQEQTMDYDVPY